MIRIVIILLGFYVYADPSENTCGCGMPNLNRPKRIVGGEIVHYHKYPWIVALFDRSQNDKLICGGTLITKRHIITAAHCVYGRKRHDISLSIGTYNLTNDRKKYTVTDIICHKMYSPSVQDYDIAILTLNSRVSQSQRCEPICLNLYLDVKPKERAKIIGWGKTGFYDNENFTMIRETAIPIASLEECQNIFKDDDITISERMLCAGDLNGHRDACQGDSGGPLMFVDEVIGKHSLLGITSFGIGCGMKGHYGIYTKVSYFNDWIFKNIGIANMKCQNITIAK